MITAIKPNNETELLDHENLISQNEACFQDKTSLVVRLKKKAFLLHSHPLTTQKQKVGEKNEKIFRKNKLKSFERLMPSIAACPGNQNNNGVVLACFSACGLFESDSVSSTFDHVLK